MRVRVKRATSWAAIYAVALHAILLGIAPVITNGSVAADPFSVICHSGSQAAAPTSEAPGKPDLIPGQACDHCNLCSASAPPQVLDMVLAGRLAPVKLPQGLRPAIAVNYDGIANNPNRTRGPPHFA